MWNLQNWHSIGCKQEGTAPFTKKTRKKNIWFQRRSSDLLSQSAFQTVGRKVQTHNPQKNTRNWKSGEIILFLKEGEIPIILKSSPGGLKKQ